MNNCIFCKIAQGQIPSHKIYEDEFTYAFLDINPATKFHTIVIPKAHCVNILDASADIFLKVMGTVKHITDLYSKKLPMANLQIIHNAGEHAQQEVPHMHIHIVPRSKNDNQNLGWYKPNPEYVEEFDQLLQLIK